MANINADVVYCLIPALRFDTTWTKIVNEIARKLISGL